MAFPEDCMFIAEAELNGSAPADVLRRLPYEFPTLCAARAAIREVVK